MDSVMVELSYEAEIHIIWTHNDQWTCAHLNLCEYPGIPVNVLRWMEKDIAQDFYPTRKEQDDMVLYTTRTLGFEVEVQYNKESGIAIDATLQNIGVPNYVKAYLENEAMKQVNEQKEVAK